MVNHNHLLAGALDEGCELVLSRRCVEVAADYEVAVAHEAGTVGVIAGVDDDVLKSVEEIQSARRGIGHDDMRVLAEAAQQCGESEGATDGIAVGAHMASEHDVVALVEHPGESRNMGIVEHLLHNSASKEATSTATAIGAMWKRYQNAKLRNFALSCK